jgi:adenine deaminase
MVMNQTLDRIALIRSVQGKEPFDVILANLNIVNVFTRNVDKGNIGIKNGRIAHLKTGSSFAAGKFFDCTGLYAVPGFIDTHVHIDSTLLTPEGLAEIIVPHGTTAIFADPMEIANVAGMAGLEAFYANADSLPYHLFLEVPSRVPTAPGLETTGGVLDLSQVEKLLDWPAAISLGELDPSKVLGLQEEYFAKVEAALMRGKIANGHTSGLEPGELSAYACAGLMDDHECISFSEAQSRLQMGLSILIREGSTERNLEKLVKGILEHGIDTRFWMMCTDDKHPNEILKEGHIDFMVNKAAHLGLDPIVAIQMATLNAATHFRLDHAIGSLAPGKWADIILTRQLYPVIPEMVFFKGRKVAENGGLLDRIEIPSPYPDFLFHTVKITRGKTSQDFFLKSNAECQPVHVIHIFPDQIVNEAEEAELCVVHGNVAPDPSRDLLKLAVVERYGKNGNIGVTFVRGFGLKKGAISSTVSHDHHNLVIVGADEESMATCAKASEEMQGGLVAAVGKEVIAALPLPFGGLMSPEHPQRVIEKLDLMNSAAKDLGSHLPAPFMTLSFISLPTVPHLGLTDRGLVDVKRHQIISSFVQ